MPIIELLSVGDDFSPLLEAVAAQLNPLQDSFRFRVVKTTSALGAEALALKRETILTYELFDWLAGRRKDLGGLNDYVICFVDRPLQSKNLGNLFGSHRADDGMAVVTLDNSDQYVRAQTRYVSYFLARYALSFVNPSIKSHADPARNWCYFDRKMDKRQIVQILSSARLCDECNKALQKGYNGRKPSPEELKALEALRQEVAGAYPRALVMRGGGVKGLAFAGALLELETYYQFDQHAGASAGAIAAILLAAKYTPTELQAVLRNTRFAEFKDAAWWKIPWNLIVHKGMFPGDKFFDWMTQLLRRKFKLQNEIKMSDLDGAVVYACQPGVGTVVFDSKGDLRGTVVAYAARCSMAIPYVFTPALQNGLRAYDGGMRNNFPVKIFLEDYPNKPFVGLYLGWPYERKRTWVIKDLWDISLDGEDRETVDNHRDQIVVIDPRPIGTTDFSLTTLEQDFLLAEGRACALEFLVDRKFQNGPAYERVAQSREEANKLRAEVTRLRRRKNSRRRWIVIGLLVAATVWWWWPEVAANGMAAVAEK